MNVLQKRAISFMEKLNIKNDNYNDFINAVRERISVYKENHHKVIFLERILLIVQTNHERHLNYCTENVNNACRFAKSNNIIITFLQNEIDIYKKELSIFYFQKNERKFLNITIENVISLQNDIKIKDDEKCARFRSELQEMEAYNFLDKKCWKQLFKGKVIHLFETGVLTQQNARKLVHKIEVIC